MNAISAPAMHRAEWRDSHVALACASAGVYAAVSLPGLAADVASGAASVAWPGAALAALLMAAPASRWWIVLAAAAPAHFIAHLGADSSWWALTWQLAHHVALALALAGILRLLRLGDVFEDLRGLSIYICAAFLLPSLLAWTAPEVMPRAVHGDAASAQWRSTALADALALIALAPAVYLWLVCGAQWLRRITLQRCAEALAIASVVYVMYALVFVKDDPQHAPLYLFFIPMLWAAVRFGVGGAATAVAAIVLLACVSGVVPHSIVLSQAGDAGLIDLQLFLTATALTALILAVVMEERQRATRALHDSEVRYRTIVESQTDLVCRNLADTTLTFVNEAYCRFFGKSRAELIGTRWLELLPPEIRDVVRARLSRLTPETPTLVHEHPVLLPDGSEGWQQWADVAFFDPAGRIIEVQGIGRDVTALKRVEHALRQNDERFRLMLRATNDAIFDWDIVRSTLWSSADGRWDDQDLGAQPWTLDMWANDIHPDDRDRVVADLRTTLDGGGCVWEAEYRYGRRGAPMQHVHERGYILRASDGSAVRMIGALSNVNDRRRLEEAQRSMARISGLATIGELSASIIHQITQPIAAMLNNAEAGLMLLSTSADRPECIREILEDVRSDGERAGEVIRNLRGMLRQDEMRRERLHVDRLLHDAIELVRAESRRRSVAIEVHGGPGLQVSGDRVRLQQVVVNLMTNSFDAIADAPAARRRINVRAVRVSGGSVRISVRDAGAGISDERLAAIFDSFITSKRDGMGLGLAIARSIIRAHGGRIWAENNTDGPGLTVHFELACATQETVDPAA